MASPILNVTELWIASTGEILDQSGTSQFHAQNNYANLILVNLEDGGGYDSTTFINFTPQTKTAYTSHWFYMSYQGLVEHEVNGEIRSFAQYAIRVPRVVLQNSNKNGFTVNDVVVKQTYGNNFIGQFATLAELNSEYPPTEALDDADSVAYVISDADNGFYQVALDGSYTWELMDSVALALETKQYNSFQIQVQAGSANPAEVVSVSEETVKILMGILNNLQVDVDRIDANIDEIEDDAILLEARVSTNEDDIDLLEGRATVNEEDIDLLEGRATNLETFQNTTLPSTYETISNVDLVRDRVEDLETFEEVTAPATYETKADATNKLALKVDKDSEIAGVAINDGITLEQLKTAIGLATTSLSGLMSATDKGYLNELYALLDTDDIDAFVNTLGEILELFENYPEGTDIVTAFAGKVDKVLTAYDTLTGESVVGTELVYIDDGGTAKKMTLAELFEAANTASGAFVPNGVYEDLTVGFAQKSASGVDIDTKFGTIDAEIDDIIDGTQNITFNNATSGLTSTTVKGAIDEIDGMVDDIIDGTTVVEEAYNANTILTHDLTFVVNGDFKANIKTINEDKIFFVKFPTTSSTSTLRVSVNDGTTYYNVTKNGATMRANIVSGQLVRLEFDGTQFIADIQGGVAIEETYGERIESTFGQFAPIDGGVPIVREIQGMTLDAPQLVVNGDFSDGTTGWTNYLTGTFTVSNGIATYVSNAGSQYFGQIKSLSVGKYYLISKHTQTVANDFGIHVRMENTPFTYALTQLLTSTNGNQSHVFDIVTATTYLIRYISQISSSTLTSDYLYLFNISTLISNKQYSPIYNTTFDLMSDAQIKAQMDAWVQDGTLPNDGVQHVENTEIKSVGKNLFDTSMEIGVLSLSTGGEASNTSYMRTDNYIKIKPSTQYYLSASSSIVDCNVFFYDFNKAFISYVGVATFRNSLTPSNASYIKFYMQGTDISRLIQLEQGTTATAYEPYVSETQTFTHGPLYRLPNQVYDSIEYRNGKYYYVQRVKKYVLQESDVISIRTTYTNLDYARVYISTLVNAGLGIALSDDFPLYVPPISFDDLNAIGKLVTNAENKYLWVGLVKGTSHAQAQADLAGTVIYYQLATPIETEITDVDGTLIQDSVTTLYQLQDLATTYKVEFAMNTEQTSKILVERDRLQQGEIDANESNIVALTARKTTTNNIIIMSETEWATYTQVTGEVYGVYDETTFVITWYYGQTA